MIKKLKLLNKREEIAYLSVRDFYEGMRGIFADNKRLDPITDRQEEFVAIPINGDVLETMLQIRKTFPEHKNFLDVGCGKGNILYLAKYANFRPKGIEFREEYKIFHNNINVFYGRAEEYEDYYDADVIYLYKPLKNNEKMDALMDMIISKCKSGAIIFPCGFSITNSKKNLQLITGGQFLYIKK